jgi:hypothetical protein
MQIAPPDFYACQNGHVGSLSNLANAQCILTRAGVGRLAPVRELPGRIGRGFFCGTCSSKMLPSKAPAGFIDEGSLHEHC